MLARTSKLLFSDAALGGIAALLCLIAYIGDWRPLHNLESWTYDIRSGLRAHPKPSENIVIVGIDDESLNRVGRWPWARSVIGELVDILRESGATVIGLGFIFSEPAENQGLQEVRAIRRELTLQAEAYSAPARLGGRSQDGPRPRDVYRNVLDLLGEAEVRLDHDAKLGASIQRTPQVVLPMMVELGKAPGEVQEIPKPVLTNAVAAPEPPLSDSVTVNLETRSLTPPLSEFLHDHIALGHLVLLPDSDRILRQEHLIVEHRGQLYPSFALRIVSAYLKIVPSEIHVHPGSHVTIGDIKIPADDALRMPISYNGPAGTFKIVPAHAVLTGQVLPEAFRDKLVLLGPIAESIADRHHTPTSHSMSGIEVVSNALQNILNKNFLSTPAWASAVELGALLAVALFLIIVVPRLDMKLAGIAAAAVFLGYFGLTTVLYTANGYMISVLYPVLLLIVGFGAIATRRFLVTAKHQEMVVADSIETNKMLGLSFQSQGMLDMAFEKFRKCPLNESVMDLLYNLAMDFERKRMFNKAINVYDHIGSGNPNFKDIITRRKRLSELGDTFIFGANLKKTSPESTVIVESGTARPTLGRYEIVKELGHGAMGTVYLGKDPKINRLVAIKTLRLDEVDSDLVQEVKERFFREAESAGRLNHPNIVTIHDAGEEQELGYIAMEVLDGTDLKDWCRKDNLLPLKRVVEIVATVAGALDYAHSQDIVHRDIKPANIMMQKDSTVKVTDFGIARITTSSKTQTGMLLGTPSYMSPEQLTSAKVDGRADLFSLGVVLFELLTGEKPFQAENPATLMYNIMNLPHASLRKVRPDAPAQLEPIIDRALEKDVTKRYQRASEMAQDLRVCLKSLN